MDNSDTATNINENNKFGLLSMMGMIMGIVMGIGIFVKNSVLISVNGDIGLTILAWTVGVMIVLSLAIAFIEIVSITEISGEQSTISNWGSKLLGIRFGKVIGYYISFIFFPIVLVVLFQFGAKQVLETISYSGIMDYSSMSPFEQSLWIFFTAVILILMVGILTSIAINPVKKFQNFATAIQIVPIALIVLLFVFLIIFNIDQVSFDKDVSSLIMESNKDMSSAQVLFLTIPAILLTFDGFLTAGSLSNDAKDKTTFRNAMVLSIFVITLLYFSYSIATLGLGVVDNTYGDYGTVSNVLYATLPLWLAEIVAPIVSCILIIAFLSSVVGYTLVNSRSMNDLSIHNHILDENGKLIEKNENGQSLLAGIYVVMLTISWLIIATFLDLLLVICYDDADILMVSAFLSDFVVTVIYLLYSTILIGGIVNRFRKEDAVKSEKSKLFIPFALIAIVLMTFVTLYFAISILSPPPVFSGLQEMLYFEKLIATFILVSTLISITIYNFVKTKNIDKRILEFKSEKSETFYNE